MVAGGPAHDERREERGETLIELLVTLLVMGIAVIGIIAGVVSVARLADHNAKSTHVANTAQSYAEELKQPVEAASAAAAAFTYEPCATSYDAFSGPLPNSTTYTAKITKIEYVSAVPTGSGAASWTDTPCTADDDDLGLQRLTVEVKVTTTSGSVSETIAVVKRDARCNYSPLFENTDQGPC